MKIIIFALIPLILSIGIIPVIPFSNADSTIPSSKSNSDAAVIKHVIAIIVVPNFFAKPLNFDARCFCCRHCRTTASRGQATLWLCSN